MIDLSNESSERIADWIEILAASQRGKPLSIQKIQELSQSVANLSSHMVPYAFRQLERRLQILGDSYPFIIDEAFIVTKKSVDNSTYLQLLFLTPGSGVSTAGSVWNLEKASKLFEDIVENSMASFFG